MYGKDMKGCDIKTYGIMRCLERERYKSVSFMLRMLQTLANARGLTNESVLLYLGNCQFLKHLDDVTAAQIKYIKKNKQTTTYKNNILALSY